MHAGNSSKYTLPTLAGTQVIITDSPPWPSKFHNSCIKTLHSSFFISKGEVCTGLFSALKAVASNQSKQNTLFKPGEDAKAAKHPTALQSSVPSSLPMAGLVS